MTGQEIGEMRDMARLSERGGTGRSWRAGARRTVVAVALVAAATMAAGTIADGASASDGGRVSALASSGDRSPARKVTDKPAPQPPTNVRVTKIGGNYVELTWTPPEDTGGLPIESYRMLELNSGRGKMVDPLGRKGEITGRFKWLDAMEPATFAVVTRTKAGFSEPSEATPVVLPYPALRVGPRTIAEGAAPSAQRLEISVVRPLRVPVDLRVRTLDESGAQAGVDYEPVDTVVTLPAHEDSVRVSIPILDDDKAEGNEALQVEVGVDGLEGSAITQTIRITDDDRGTK